MSASIDPIYLRPLASGHMAGDFQLMLMPGLGADAALFEPQRRRVSAVGGSPVDSSKKNESLSAYAARMAEMIEPPPSGPWILGGVSMGGMIAYEMARHRKPDAVVLIASCRTRQSLRHGFHAGAHVVPWLPVGIWSVAKWLAPSVLAGSRRYDAAAQSRLVRMFQEMDSAFMHWALSAILGWNPTLLAGVRRVPDSRRPRLDDSCPKRRCRYPDCRRRTHDQPHARRGSQRVHCQGRGVCMLRESR